MIKFTSKPLKLTVKGYDLTSATAVYVNISQPADSVNIEISTGITKTKSVIDNVTYTTLSVPLAETDTGKFNENHKAEVQVNFVLGSVRYATVPRTICIVENLKSGVIS